VICVFCVAIGVSIVKGGAVLFHYLIQMVPMTCILAAAPFSASMTIWRGRLVTSATVAILALASHAVFAQYRIVTKRALQHRPLGADVGYDIAAYLREANRERAPVYLMTDHIAYWLSGTSPLTKVTTHPSNIARKYLLEVISGAGASTQSEIRRVFAARPLFVVKTAEVWYLARQPDARELLAHELATHYSLVTRIRAREVYRRKPGTD